MAGIEIIVIPSRKGLTILPTALVRQVLPYAPVITEGDGHYVRGSLIVQYDKLPVIDLDYIYDAHHQADEAQQSHDEEGSKLIWVKSLGADDHALDYVLIARGAPQILTCTADELETVTLCDKSVINRRVQLDNIDNPNDLPIFLLDLFILEAELASV
ncbi:hypothetical protein L0B52_03860 [Suttonella sp. R2A3]|uniref:hypothetical protein n=1 Tax=Suttonella sp. R2A3 TaxID=2908648 RepID=UPI001F486E10|nr:hypothetical protein [Suttonella sp. R2A3]UJF25293.1 hypothetical protein L0B52_03860 [Suttonella sp. R2A3]